MLLPSGVPWLGDIPAGWKMERLGVLYTHRNEKVSDKDFPPLSVTMKGVVPQLATAAKTDDGDNRKLVRKGDFAINSRSDRRGSCGISAYDGSVSLINTILTPRGQMSPAYFDWLFHTEAFADEFYKWGHGIVDDLWTTRWSEMKRIYIVRPPLPEQRAIADYLDEKCGAIDAAIAEAKKGIEEYKAWKKSLIFETVTGKRRVGAFNAEKRRGGEAEKMKPSAAVLISALLFGVMHRVSVHTIYAVVCGMILSACYYYTESIFASITIHSVFNIVGSGLGELLKIKELGVPAVVRNEVLNNANAVCIVAMVPAAIAFLILRHNAKKSRQEQAGSVAVSE